MPSGGSYVSNFASILFGLAVGEILIDFHRLLRSKHRVTWHWLPLFIAFYALMSIISSWWEFYTELLPIQRLSIAAFLPSVVTMTFMFLIAAAALPDRVEEPIDLKQFYFENARYLWRLYALYIVWIVIRRSLIVSPGFHPGLIIIAGLHISAMIYLSCTRRPLVHYVLPPLMLAQLLSVWLSFTVG